MIGWRWIAAPMCALSLAASAADDAGQRTDALGWLNKIYEATRGLSYSGTFVYQQGVRSETSRITRFSDARGGIERLEVLDGSPREIVRSEDGIVCYLPELRILKIDRASGRRNFPAVLPEQIHRLLDNYEVTLGERTRVAGRECQAVKLVPRDELRYGYELCADRDNGMLLRSVTFNERQEPVEQFTFTQLSVGNVSRDKVKPRHATRSWRVEEALVRPIDLASAGWNITANLPGFHKIIEVTRRLREAHPVNQIVYSDGLAAVSVFIEPSRARAGAVRSGLASVGGINIYTREVSDHVVTVVGEAPAISVQRIANQVQYRRPQ